MAHGSGARRDARARLAVTPFDVIVIGANLVGCGIALDASARGLRTALLEQEDFGAGDCSGGSDLFPLLQAPVSALSLHHLLGVVEAAAERQYLRQIAPHLMGELPIVVPAFEDAVDVGPVAVPGPTGGPRAWPDRTWWSSARRRARRVGLAGAADLLSLAPLLRAENLVGGWAGTRVEVDEAVLSLALARTAALDGAAVVLNGVSATVRPAPPPTAGGPGPTVLLGVDGEQFELSARVVVQARGVTGPGATGATGGRLLRASVRRPALPLDAALVLPGDGRSPAVSCVPGPSHTRLGTVLEAPVSDAAGLERMLAAVSRLLTCTVGSRDVTATWSERCPPLQESRALRLEGPGRMSVVGGTVTTYREIARHTVDAVVDGLDDRARLRLHRRSLSHRSQLRGSVGWAEVRDGQDLGSAADAVDDATRHRLAHRYGGEARVVLAMVAHRPEWGQPLVEGLPYLAAEAVYAVRYEMARTMLDVLARRTPALLEDADATAAAADRVASLVAAETGWGQRRRAEEIGSVREEAAARRGSEQDRCARAAGTTTFRGRIG